MTSLRLLGYANSNPCAFRIDRATPYSQFSSEFLFRQSLPAHLNVKGMQYARLTILVPSRGGYYMSTNLVLECSRLSGADVVLGADWLSATRAFTTVNVLREPSLETELKLPDEHQWVPDARFSPLSLLHSREDQWRFSGELPLPGPGVSPSTPALQSEGGGSSQNPYSLAGYHDQAASSADHQRMAMVTSAPAAEGDVTRHDPCPTYDTDLVLQLLKSCFATEQPAFWGRVMHEHQITTTITHVDAFHVSLVKHVFSGTCVFHHGSGCEVIVRNERWPQSMGIRMVNDMLEWLDQGALSLAECTRICEALDLQLAKTHQKRSLQIKLSDRRRHLFNVIDAAELSLDQLIPHLGSTSSVKEVRSVSAAHGIKLSDNEKKDAVTAKIFEHVARGKCADGHKSSPGCENVTRHAFIDRVDSTYLQVAVLYYIVDAASKKQLNYVLDAHDIKYDSGESHKKLQARLKKYTQDIERGKLSELKASFGEIERLRRLDDIRKQWPKLLPLAFKEKIVKDFRAATSSSTLATFTCACCARSTSIRDQVHRSHKNVNIDLLQGPSDHWTDAHFKPPPAPFSEGPLSGKLLDERGVMFCNGDITLELCSSCARCLHRGSLPKHALANRLYVGPVPAELQDLTMVEESMVAQARAKSWIVKLQEQDPDTASPTIQRGLKGHTIIYPQKPDKLATMLPPPVGETLTFICVIFSGSSQLTNEWLRNKAKPLLVRREKVRNALVWLKANNPLYKDVEISGENLDALPHCDILPYHVENVRDCDAQEVVVSRYDGANKQQHDTISATHFESVVVTDVDAHTPASQLRAAAVRHAKTQGKPFVQVTHGSNPVNEFFNVDLFPMIYPTLYPYGCGGFEDRARKKRISMKEHAKYLFSLQDKRFQTHYSFLFTVFNILQRRALLLGCSLKVKKATFNQFARHFASVSSEAIGEVLGQVEKGDMGPARTDEERKVLQLMKEVNLVTAKVPGSSSARTAMRNEIRALTATHGMPSFYITINPADTHNPVVKFLAGADIDLDNMLQDNVPNYWEQSKLVASNPALGAAFFNAYIKAFLRTVLRYDGNELNEEGGILGTVKAHYGCVEAQGRGSLHCHMLVWIGGALNPNEIRERVIQDPLWAKTLLDYLDDTITNIVPEDPIPDISTPWDEWDPCTLRGVDLSSMDTQERLALRMKDINRLAERVQRHKHSHTCYKHYKPGDARTCRFDLKEENFRAESSVDLETGQICLRCLDGLVNNFNMTILEAVRCNMDIQFIGSGESAKAMIYYITDYITKSQLKSHVAYAALQLAVKKCETVDDTDDDFVVRSKRLLQKCAYALISHQEMSAQQVASYLMGFEDHFTSHDFGRLYWASFERFVESQDTEKLGPGREHNHDAEGNDVNDDVDIEAGTQGPGEDVETPDQNVGAASGGADGLEDDEEVSIGVEKDGSVVMLADQIADYTQRPTELTSMCLWDFVAKAEKVRGKRSDVVETDGRETDGTDVDGVDETENDMSAPRQRRRTTENFHFLPEHKEYGRKQVRLRGRDVVPVPIGPALPRRDHVDSRARYCRLMLILFKPWRTVDDLRDDSRQWENVFDCFSAQMDMTHLKVMDNMQVLHECRDSRNDHMQTRVRQRSKPNQRGRDEDGAPGNELEELDMTEVLEHLEDIDRMSSRRNEEACREAQECLDELGGAGFFAADEGGRYSVADGDATGSTVPTRVEDDVLEDEWRDTYEKRKSAWKRQAAESGHDETGSMTTINCMDGMEQVADVLMNGRMDSQQELDVATDGPALIAQVAERWTLNKEQRRAFEIVAEHSMKDKPDQLLMYLGGPGGTGKSRVVNALRDFFQTRNQGRRFRLAAYTGVAARNIGGATLHSLLQLNDTGRGLSAKARRDLAALWDGVDYLFVDELSMLGCEMLHNVSHALAGAKGNTTAFGNINVILAGDFAQLPPIGDTRLYKDVNTSVLSASATNRGQGKVLGRLLWLSFETVVILHETMRQSGRENTVFVDMLQRLRDGDCNKDDYTMLRGRCLQQRTDELNNDDWRFAPVIVTSNATRDAINRKAAEAFAAQHSCDLHWYHAVDTHKKAVVTDPALIEKLESQHSGQTKHRLRRIPLVIGMPVAVNQNFDVAAGVVNGSHGILRQIRYFTNADGQRYLKSCVVEIPNSEDVDIPHLPKHHFPVLPDTTELRFEHGASHRCCTISRKQVPIEPGFAMTVHKAQGQTMKRVIVDLASCTGTEAPYVMVSRATSLQGVKVLRKFDDKQIKKRRSEELRTEFDRLQFVRWQTVAKYGGENEVREAKEKVAEMRGARAQKGAKRKRANGEERGPAKNRKKKR